MSLTRDDVVFWVGLVLFSAGVSLFLNPDYRLVGELLVILGTASVLFSIRKHLIEATSGSGLTIILMLVVLVAVGYDIYQRSNAAPPPEIFLSWGGASPGQCSAILNGSGLTKWQKGYHVLLVCGLPNPQTDRLESQNITVSGPFTIQADAIPVSVPFSEKMKAEIVRLVGPAVPVTPVSPLMVFTVWFQAAVIPDTCSGGGITRLSDISRCGGVLLDARGGSEGILNTELKKGG